MRKSFVNVGFLYLDQFVRLILSFFVGIWVARYLGPEDYGTLNYVIAVVVILRSLSEFGFGTYLSQHLVSEPEHRSELLGTVVWSRFFSGLLIVLLLGFWWIFVNDRADRFGLILIYSFYLLFDPFIQIRTFFDSIVESKYAIYAASFATFLTIVAKIALIVTSAPLLHFVVVSALEVAFAAVALLWIYRYRGNSLRALRLVPSRLLPLLRDSAPFFIAGLATVVLMRLDQVMLGRMLGSVEVGIYSAAVRLSEAWLFLPGALIGSALPTLIRNHSAAPEIFKQRLQKLSDLLTLTALGVALGVTLLAPWIIPLLFGVAYSDSAAVLAIHVWSGLLVGFSALRERYLQLEGRQGVLLYTSIAALLLNFTFNLLLIPRYGAIGAAFATLAARLICDFLIDLLFAPTRPLFFLQLRSLML